MSETGSGPPETGSGPPGAFRLGAVATAAAVAAAIAMVVSICQNSTHRALEMTLAFDAGHYVGSSQKIMTLWHYVLSHGLSAIRPETLRPLAEDLMLDGPMLPLIGAKIFILTNTQPTPAAASVLVWTQSFIHALTSGCLAVLASRLTGSARWALFAGLTWALYPAAVIGAGKFLPETWAVFFISAQLLALETARRRASESRPSAYAAACLAGLFTAAILLTKSALAPAAVAVDALAVFSIKGWRKQVAAALTLAAGFSILIAPWLLFTKVATGAPQLTPQRRPVMNVVTGCDIETDGWGSVPDAPIVRQFSEADGVLPAAAGIWLSRPAESASLLIRKLPRLWQSPWNDFRANLLRIPVVPQALFHLGLVLLGLAGLLVCLCRGEKGEPNGARFLAGACTLYILGHLVYLPFVACSRYGFTAMPALALLAALGLSTARSLRQLMLLAGALLCLLAVAFSAGLDLNSFCALIAGPGASAIMMALAARLLLAALAFFLIFRFCLISAGSLRQRAIAVSLAAFLGFSIVTGAATLSDRAGNEWKCPLSPGSFAVRIIESDLPEPSAISNAFVVYDSEPGYAEPVLLVNGTRIDARPSSWLRKGDTTASTLFEVFCALLGKTPAQMRQWQSVPVPPEVLRAKGGNELALTAAKEGQSAITGASTSAGGHGICIPSLRFFSPTKLVNTQTSLDGRPPDFMAGLTPGKCFLRTAAGEAQDDLSPAAGRQFGSYRLFLVLVPQTSFGTVARFTVR